MADEEVQFREWATGQEDFLGKPEQHALFGTINQAKDKHADEATRRAAEDAKNVLARTHFPLVKSIAKRYSNTSGVDYRELVSAGMEGLAIAMDCFRLEHNTKLTTYACWWIHHTIQQAIRRERHMLTGSTPPQDYIRAVGAAMSRYETPYPTPEQVAEFWGKTPEQALAMQQRHDLRVVSTSGNNNDSDDLEGYTDRVLYKSALAQRDGQSPLFPAMTKELLELVLNGLSARKALVIILRYNLACPRDQLLKLLKQILGFLFNEEELGRVLDRLAKNKTRVHEKTGGYTHDEIAALLSVSRSAICQTEQKAIEELGWILRDWRDP